MILLLPLRTCSESNARGHWAKKRDPRVTWAYGQRRGLAGVYEVEIVVEVTRVASSLEA